MKKEEIRDICESHGINPDGAELFNEDYIISKTGDLICGINWSYSIWDNMLKEDNWFNHLSYKNWYKVETFVPAYIEALCRQNVESLNVLVGRKKITIEPFKIKQDGVLMKNLIVLLDIINSLNHDIIATHYGRL